LTGLSRLVTRSAVAGAVFFGVFYLLGPVFAPDWLHLRRPVVLNAPTPIERTETAGSYSAGALRALPSIVSVYAVQRRQPANPFFPFGGLDPEQGGGLGSGVVMSADGYVLTNNHVIQGAGAVAVEVGEGRPARAEVVGTDPETDLAVLKIDAEGLQPIAVGDSDGAQIGDWVLAIGNPFGVGQTVTQGIVSGTGRNRVGINTFENFIQTDAAINPGNSGGALVDAAGRLIGINTAILSPSGGSLGIGFAIPSRTALEVMTQLVTNGRVERGWLGVEALTLTAEIARRLGVEVRQGAVLVRLLRGGPADAGGLQPGDVVVAVDGTPVRDTVDLINQTAAIKPGESGRYTVRRGRDQVELNVKTGRRPPIEQAGRR
jgi:Do/DeqQ family serine protease